jgi:hypothetical protein
MLDEFQRRKYNADTVRGYIHAVRALSSSDHLVQLVPEPAIALFDFATLLPASGHLVDSSRCRQTAKYQAAQRVKSEEGRKTNCP